MDSFDGYKRLVMNHNDALLQISGSEKLKSTDAVIFDCDGVLIDSRGSYDRAIEVTVAYFLSSLLGLKANPPRLTQQLVEALRETGQYNNDIDATAAILVSIVANLPCNVVMKCLQNHDGAAERLQDTFTSEGFAGRALNLSEMASSGFSSFVDKIKTGIPDSGPCVDALLERLAYPGGPASSLLSRVFDEYFYGPVLLKKLHGLDPVVGCRTGLIASEKVLVSAETLRSLSSLLRRGMMGIVSGRSHLGTEYSLAELMQFFQEGPMIFLEDHDANVNAKQPIPGKPSPESLLFAADHLEPSKSILYVGDSVEDLMMTHNANRIRPKFTFCGIVGTANSPRRTASLADRGADAILESVNDLPALLADAR